MSDIKQKKNMLSGDDGNPSMRKWGAVISFFTSIGFTMWGMIKIVEVNSLAVVHLIYFAPAVLFIAVGLVLIGFLSKQNVALIKSLVSKEKS